MVLAFLFIFVESFIFCLMYFICYDVLLQQNHYNERMHRLHVELVVKPVVEAIVHRSTTVTLAHACLGLKSSKMEYIFKAVLVLALAIL